MRRNFTESILSSPHKLPELDRNTKPKSFGSKSSVELSKPRPQSIAENEETNEGPPPPIPERISPKPFANVSKKRLERTQEIDDDGESDMTSSDDSISKETNCNQDSDEKSRGFSAPPLPPKAKILTPTKSSPLPLSEGSIDENNENPFFRSSSVGTRPKNELDLEENDCECDHENDESEDSPPEVPCRVPLNNLVSEN